MKEDISVLILGASLGSYAACRCFYTEYGIRPFVLDRALPPLFRTAKCARGIPSASFDIAKPSLCLHILENVKESLGKRVLLLPATADYATFLREWEEDRSLHFILPFHLSPSLPCFKQREEAPFGFLVALLDEEGEGSFCYAEAPVLLPSGKPAFWRTSALLPSLLPYKEALQGCKASGIFTFPLWKTDEGFDIGKPSCDLSSFPFFALAADISPAEFLLFRFVLCIPFSAPEVPSDGLYRLAPFPWLLSLCKDKRVKKDIRLLHRKGWEIGLLDAKKESRFPKSARARREAFREYAFPVDKSAVFQEIQS